MKFPLGLGIGVLGLAISLIQPAEGCLEVQGQAPVALPQCVGQKAIVALNRALRSNEPAAPLQIEMIDDGQQTNFALNGTRLCAGSMTSLGGSRYTGTWSYTRVGHSTIRVRFSLKPEN